MKYRGKNIILFYTPNPFRMTQVMMTESYLWDFRFSHQYCKRFKSHGMWYCVIGPAVRNISGDHGGSKKLETNRKTKVSHPRRFHLQHVTNSKQLSKFTKKSPSTTESTQTSQLISGSNYNINHAVKFHK